MTVRELQESLTKHLENGQLDLDSEVVIVSQDPAVAKAMGQFLLVHLEELRQTIEIEPDLFSQHIPAALVADKRGRAVLWCVME